MHEQLLGITLTYGPRVLVAALMLLAGYFAGDWAERSALALPPPGVTEPLPADALVAGAAGAEPARATNVRYAADPRMPARIAFANGSILCVNAYTPNSKDSFLSGS